MKTFRSENKDFRIFVFTTFTACISYLSTILAGMEGDQAAICTALVIPFLNGFVKRINVKFFGDIGVVK